MIRGSPPHDDALTLRQQPAGHGSIGAEVRYAARALRARPLYTLAGVVTLALGIE